nr:uncharacterized protein LOC128699256 [Cherax quadricarinatus]
MGLVSSNTQLNNAGEFVPVVLPPVYNAGKPPPTPVYHAPYRPPTPVYHPPYRPPTPVYHPPYRPPTPTKKLIPQTPSTSPTHHLNTQPMTHILATPPNLTPIFPFTLEPIFGSTPASFHRHPAIKVPHTFPNHTRIKTTVKPPVGHKPQGAHKILTTHNPPEEYSLPISLTIPETQDAEVLDEYNNEVWNNDWSMKVSRLTDV